MGYDNEHAATNWMVFDIETIPMPDCDQYLVEPIEAPSNYKDPEKIKQYIAEKRQKQIAEASLDLDLCQVAAISVAFHDAAYVQTRATTPESEMLDGFWRFAKDHRLVGFNCLMFDLPILQRRSLYLGVRSTPVSLDRYRTEVVDLADILTYHGKMTWRSLEFYAKRFDIAYDNSVKGEDILKLAAAGNWTAIANHALADATTTRELAARMGAIAWLRDTNAQAVAI